MPHLNVTVQPDNVNVGIGSAANYAIFVPRAESGQFASESELLAASGLLRAYISGADSDVSSLNGLTGGLILTGLGGLQVIPSGTQYIVLSGGAGGAVFVTGGNVSAPNFYGANFINVYTTGSDVIVSGTGIASAANLALTGQGLSNLLYQLSGVAVLTGGNQTIGGIKTFAASLLQGVGHFESGIYNFLQGLGHISSGDYSHLEGYNNVNTATAAHVEGVFNETHAHYSHAEGTFNKTYGLYSHAEGVFTQASGAYSHSEGGNTSASGLYSHAEGLGTIALGNNQLTVGQYNEPDITSLFIIGNGADQNNKSNIFAANISGVDIRGYLKISGNSVLTGLYTGDLATAFNLFQTGQTLWNRDATISGTLYPNYNPSGYITSSGIQSLTGALNQSGLLLAQWIQSLSGVVTGDIANLTASGIKINGWIISLSGDLLTSGRNLDNKINSLSGIVPSGRGANGYYSKWIGVTGLSTGIIYENNGLLGVGNVAPVSRLDVSGLVTASGFVTNNQVITNQPLLDLTQVWTGANTLFTGVRINIVDQTSVTGSVYFDVSSNGLSVLRADSASGVSIPNGVIGGSFEFPANPGLVTMVDFPIISGFNSTGEQSYAFNAGGTRVLRISAEYDNNSGIQNAKAVISSGAFLQFHGGIALNPTGVGSTGTNSFNFGLTPFYVFTGSAVTTGTLPPITTSTGRMYFVKNRGQTGFLVTGSDLIYADRPMASYNVLSGQAFIFINDSQYWSVM